jgi:hypothetical protein
MPRQATWLGSAQTQHEPNFLCSHQLAGGRALVLGAGTRIDRTGDSNKAEL